MALTADKLRQGAAGVSAGGYEIDNSLRFNDDDSAYLSRTFSTPTDGKKWSFSFWVKRGNLSGSNYPRILSTPGGSHIEINFMADDTLRFEAPFGNFIPSQKFRDVSAWYYILYIYDSTETTASNRLKMYVNGSQVSDFDTESYPSSNQVIDLNSAVSHKLGMYATGASEHFDGYLAEVNFVDGQALSPTDFGETGDYGEWKPIEYTGTYGTNGFYLDFENTAAYHTLTANGNTQHSTAQSKIGSSSIYFDGTGDYLSVPDDAVWDNAVGSTSGGYTWEAWVRFSDVTARHRLFTQRQDANNYITMGVETSGKVSAFALAGGSYKFGNGNGYNNGVGTALTNNTWHHIALVRNGSIWQLYIDGTAASEGSETQSGTGTYSAPLYLGSDQDSSTWDMNGYMDEIRISNTARYTSGFTPSTSAFTEDANTLLLIHSDTTNGSTTFTDSSTTYAGLGTDASSNTNDWTTNNLAATDQMLDSPTNNFCTWNPLSQTACTLSEGNTKFVSNTGNGPCVLSSMNMSSGKWYMEVCSNVIFDGVGVQNVDDKQMAVTTYSEVANLWWFYNNNSTNFYKIDQTSPSASGSGNSIGAIYQVAIDVDANKVWIGVDNTWRDSGNPATGANPYFTITSNKTYAFVGVGEDTAAGSIANFGQDSSFAGNKTAQSNTDDNGYGDFYYEPPAGFNALCTANLSDPAVIPSEHFNTVTYSGNSTVTAHTGLGFQPDLCWFKRRSGVDSHLWYDAVRGNTKVIKCNNTGAEGTDGSDTFKSFDSDGFTLGTRNELNHSSHTFVAWNWNCPTTFSGNTDGTITSSGRKNTDAGFSIVSYTGTGAVATVGHGLSKQPELVIHKTREATWGDHWNVYVDSLGANKVIRLNLTDSFDAAGGGFWNDTAPTSSIINLGGGSGTSGANEDYIAYCWHSVDGYSKIGSYTGNGSTDGTFVYTGFRPAYVMWKSANSGHDWNLLDSARTPENVVDKNLYPNGGNAEMTSTKCDFTSNGFKIRTADNQSNTSGGTYIYLAFAETDFKHSTAR